MVRKSAQVRRSRRFHFIAYPSKRLTTWHCQEGSDVKSAAEYLANSGLFIDFPKWKMYGYAGLNETIAPP